MYTYLLYIEDYLILRKLLISWTFTSYV